MTTPVAESVEEYLRHLEDLYNQIREWLREVGLAWEEKSVAIHEERSGQYAVPRLLIRRPDGEQVAELNPIGADIIGAEGRVDLRGPLDSRPILYLLKGGPTFKTAISTSSGEKQEEHVQPLFKGIDHEGWYTPEDRRPKSVQALERETFLDLLKQVADYEQQ
jgi:hypothetical protein